MSGSASGNSKKSGSYLARQKAKKAGGVVTEEDLRKKAVITPTDVTKLSKMTKGEPKEASAKLFRTSSDSDVRK